MIKQQSKTLWKYTTFMTKRLNKSLRRHYPDQVHDQDVLGKHQKPLGMISACNEAPHKYRKDSSIYPKTKKGAGFKQVLRLIAFIAKKLAFFAQHDSNHK